MSNSGYKFPIINSNGTTSTTVVDFDDMFVSKDSFLDAGIYAWGQNSVGQLAQGGNLTHRSSPIQIGSLTNWKQVSSGDGQTSAVKTDGTLWSWGYNIVGQLGLGNTTNRSSPVQVGQQADWSLVACGDVYTLAITSVGELWSIGGQNNSGQLGLRDTTNRSSPVQVGSLTNWKQVMCGGGHTVAITTSGELYSWGNNTRGELGLGDVAHRSSPVQVGSLSNWKQISGDQNTLAIKTDGSLWAWGHNGVGRLGLGNLVHRSSPVQVGSLLTWKQVVTTQAHTLAIKTDGTLWAWGLNTNGQLGLADVAHRSSPIQVGSLTNWKQAAAGIDSSVVISSPDLP